MKWESTVFVNPKFDTWFAWYPVKCEDGQTRWLERVGRRREWGIDYGGGFCNKLYFPIEAVQEL